MGWLFVGGVLGLIPRVIAWVVVWNLIGEDWHWLPHALVSWLLGDLVATIAMGFFRSR